MDSARLLAGVGLFPQCATNNTLFLFAILFAYLAEPLVGLFEKLLHGRIRGIIAFYVLLLSSLAMVSHHGQVG